MDSETTSALVERIAGLAERLQRDVTQQRVSPSVLHDIREMRRSLNTLEERLVDDLDTIGDAS